jgi:hypothetical protein
MREAESMDHSEAVDRMASEKYLLDELAVDEREAFEEHLFECHECAVDVRAGSVFLERSKLELAKPPALRAPATAKQSSSWWAWLRPAFAVPAMAALLIVVGYQNFVTYPSLKGALAETRAPRILPAAHLVGATRRDVKPPATVVHPEAPFLLPLDISSKTAFHSYRIEFHNPAGGVDWVLPVSAEAISDTLVMSVPGVNQAGEYTIVVFGLNENGESSDIGHYHFELQFPAGVANP